MSQRSASDHGLFSFLGAVRRRQFLAGFGRYWVAVVSTALLLAAAAVLLVGWSEPAVQRPLGLDPWSAVAVVLVCLTLLAAALAALRMPALASSARLVDRSLGLGALVSTSLEMLGRRGPQDATTPLPVRALYEELGERLAAAEPADVVPLRPPRWSLVLPLACGVFALAAVVPLQGAGTAPQLTGEQPPTSAVADDLRLLADVLESAPAVESALSSFASDLRAVGQRIDAAGAIDEETTARLASLLESLAVEASTSTSFTGRLIDAGFDASRSGSGDRSKDSEPFTFGSERTAAEGSAQEPTSEGDETKVSDFDPASVFRTLGQVASSVRDELGPTAASAASGADDTGAAVSRPSQGGFYTDWDEEMADALAARMAAIRQRGRGQAVAGEASQSDDSPGDAAGHGTQPVTSGAEESPADLAALKAEQVNLAAELREDGGTSTYLPEPEVRSQSDLPLTSGVMQTLVSASEGPTRVERVLGSRDVVAAYFARGVSSSSEAAP